MKFSTLKERLWNDWFERRTVRCRSPESTLHANQGFGPSLSL
jgi:hypothetical protein